MRHKKLGRVLGRSSSHRKALYRNLATALILTERETFDFDPNPPKVKGRIVTTLEKAKEIRPLVEKCVTLARKCRKYELASSEFGTEAQRNTEQWREWRKSDQHAKWVAAQAPAVHLRRRLYQILQDKHAVQILCDTLAERFEDRPGGYTRILRLAKPRLGDAGTRAILEFVGRNDRVTGKSQKPSFEVEEGSNSEGSNSDGNGSDSSDSGLEAGESNTTTETRESSSPGV